MNLERKQLGFDKSNNMYLLTEWEGRTGKYLARGHGRTERAQRGPVQNDQEPNIFPSGADLTQSVRILSYDNIRIFCFKQRPKQVRTPFWERAGRLFTAAHQNAYGPHHVTFLYGFY